MRPRRPLSAVMASAIIAIAALPLLAGPVAATPAANDAQFRAAWADPNETLITLTSSIVITCSGLGGSTGLVRSSTNAIVIDGAGFELSSPCVGDTLDQTDTGTVTFRNLRLTGNASSGDGIEQDGDLVIEAGSVVSGHGIDGADVSGTTTISASTVTENGRAGIDGDGNIAVTDSIITNNGLDGANGLTASGDVSITRTLVHGNGGKGGAGIQGTDVAVVDSTISENEAFGIDATNATVTNSTITGHIAVGILGQGTVIARQVTLSGNGTAIENHTPLDDGDVRTVQLFGSVLVEPEGQNCLEETFVDEGFNFVDDASCGSIPANAAPHLLGVLGANGGPTPTRLPGAGSPLIDAIPAASCVVTADQRGISRPQDGDGNGTAGCDIGAVEVAAAAVTPTPSPATSQLPNTSSVGGRIDPILPMISLVLLLLSVPALVRRFAIGRR